MKVLASIAVVVGLWTAVFLTSAFLAKLWVGLNFAQKTIVLGTCLIALVTASFAWHHVFRNRERPAAISPLVFGATILVISGGISWYCCWALSHASTTQELLIPAALGLGGILSCIVPAMLEAVRRLRK